MEKVTFYGKDLLVDGMMLVADNGKKHNQSVYSDRLWQWDPEKYDKCCMEVWRNEGQEFYSRNCPDIEKFLRLYTGHEELELCRVLQGENQSNGFPLWRFDYYINEK